MTISAPAPAFDIKSASLDLLALVLRSTDPAQLEPALQSRFSHLSANGQSEAFVLGLEALPSLEGVDLGSLLPLMGRHGIKVVALRHPDPAQAALASRYGLGFTTGGGRSSGPAQETAAATPVAPAQEPATSLIIDRPVRAGQQIYAKGGDLVILAVVSAGAEVIADGNIHVYGPLRGRALAGARGNTSARIFTQAMEAELVSVAGVYRTIEQALPDSIRHKPTQIYLENERLVMKALHE